MRSQLLVAAAAVLCGLLAGCGGDSNEAPVANAGARQSVLKRSSVTLDGTASTDPDGDALSYRWTQTAGSAVTLTGSTSDRPTFVAPAQSGDLTFSLVVNDGHDDSKADTVTVTVQNQVPVADPGVNISVFTTTVVTLDGRASSDPDGDTLTYAWWQKSGPAVSMVDHGDGTATFTTPDVAATVEFLLTVNDGESSASEDVVVVVEASVGGNLPPIADAGSDFEVPKRGTVQLNGTGYDPEFVSVTYSWRQTGGTPVILNDATLRYPSFTAPDSPTDLVFELTTGDGALTSVPDSVTVTVRNYAPLVTAITLTPAAPRTLDDLTAEPDVYDPDGDPITLTYEWQRNGVTIAGQQSATLPNTEQAKSDSITVIISASDGTESSFGEINVVIEDTPPTLVASPPTQVDYGDSIGFQLTTADPDDDPPPALALDYGPAGMTIDADGFVTWTADSPLFERTMDFNWRVVTTTEPISALGGTITVNDADRAQAFRRTGIEIPYGPSGLVVSDLDGDGDLEVLVGSRQGLYELAKSGSDYVQVWTEPYGDGSRNVAAVATADLDGDGKQEIFYAAGSTITRLDGESRRSAASYAPEEPFHCRDIEVADLTGDGDLELVCLGSQNDYQYEDTGSIMVFDAATLDLEWQSPELNAGRTLAVGNVDADAALEIVTSGGFVYDGASLANEWAYDPGFGSFVDTGDLDGDGVEEIVGMGDWDFVRGYSAVLKSPIWEQSAFDLDSLLVANIDGDAADEIVVGDGQWGDVTAYDYVTATNSLSQAWQIPNPEHGVTSIAVGDIDGDGGLEFIWGSGATSSGEDVLAVAGFNPGIEIEWRNEDPVQLGGNFTGGSLATVAPGEQRIMFETATTDSGYSGMRLIGLDPLSGAIDIGGEQGSNWASAAALDVFDYDNDGIDEVIAATASFYDAYYAIIDFAADTAERTVSLDDQDTGVAVTHADLNDDGADDFVGISSRGFVEVRDVLHNALIWKSTSVSGGGVDVAVADLDNDGTPEIIALSSGRVVVYRKNDGPVAYVESRGQDVDSAIDLLVADTDDDGQPEIYVLGGYYFREGKILRFDASLNLLGSADLEGQPSSIFLEDTTAGRKNIVVSQDLDYGGISVEAVLAAVDPESGAVVWQSPKIDDVVRKNSLSYVDPDGDGQRQIAFGTGAGMYLTR